MKRDPVKHVVLLVLENRSCDQMLGSFTEIFPEFDGVKPGAPGTNRGVGDVVYQQEPTREAKMNLDPPHEGPSAIRQVEGNNSGFIGEFERAFPNASRDEKLGVMGYYPMDSLCATKVLAENFTLCDRWFCSVLGPTWQNRFFALSGTSLGYVTMPEGHGLAVIPHFLRYTQETVFDRLNEKRIPWKVYFHDLPQSLVMLRQLLNLGGYHPFTSFARDAKTEASFPAFSLIEPAYFGNEPNDDHPPHSTYNAQRLIADVYNALRSNDELWNSTLLIVTYDEHGGFYDHVPPPPAVAPDDHVQEYSFDRLGVRVPALLISPWVDRRVCKSVFDHTSILKYLIEKWDLGNLGRRAAQANSIGEVIRQSGGPRSDTPERIEVKIPLGENTTIDPTTYKPNGQQRALLQFFDSVVRPRLKNHPNQRVSNFNDDTADGINAHAEEARNWLEQLRLEK